MPASPPTTPQLGLPRFASDMSTAIWNGLNTIVDAIDNLYTPWTSYTPNWTQSDGTVMAIGDGVLTGRYRKLGKVVHWVIYWERGSSTNQGGSYAWGWSTPPHQPLVWNRVGGSVAMIRGGNHMGGSVFPTTATTVGAIIGDIGRVSGSTPAVTQAVGDWILLSGTYEAA